jgi:hypothetical protein
VSRDLIFFCTAESEGIGTVDLFLDLDKGDLKDIGMVRGLWMSADQLLVSRSDTAKHNFNFALAT